MTSPVPARLQAIVEVNLGVELGKETLLSS